MIRTGDPVLPLTGNVNVICPLRLPVALSWALLLMSAAITSDECLYFFRAWVVSRYLGVFVVSTVLGIEPVAPCMRDQCFAIVRAASPPGIHYLIALSMS